MTTNSSARENTIKKMMGKLQTFAQAWADGASGTLTHKEGTDLDSCDGRL